MSRLKADLKSNPYSSYYTDSSEITTYMTSLLAINDGENILEPCAGKGAFIKPLLEFDIKVNITAIDINELDTIYLKQKFGEKVEVIRMDTIADSIEKTKHNLEEILGFSQFDKIIGNPPFGAWLEYETRNGLKQIYPGQYVRDTYALFLIRGIELLKEGGRLVFILPDTFLALRMHRPLRDFIINNCVIESITMFPSNYFPGISFGYSNLCIISIRKENCLDIRESNILQIIDNLHSKLDLKLLAKKEIPSHIRVRTYEQNDVYSRDEHLFIAFENISLNEFIINKNEWTVGEIADCKTGIYTGDNRHYIGLLQTNLSKHPKGYKTITTDLVTVNMDYQSKINGIKSDSHWVPIVKGGRYKYVQQNIFVIDWSPEAIQHYKLDKKARFQNSQYYFKNGLGVPMVSSTKGITACLLNNRIFDQSVVGIFPKDDFMLIPMLLLLNSPIVSYILKRGINHTTNNSANYLKRIPLPSIKDKNWEHLNEYGEAILNDYTLGQKSDIENEAYDFAQSLFGIKMEEI